MGTLNDPCPLCGTKALHIEWRLKAKPVGTFSLSGMGMKFSASEVPWLVCDTCKMEVEGKRE